MNRISAVLVVCIALSGKSLAAQSPIDAVATRSDSVSTVLTSAHAVGLLANRTFDENRAEQDTTRRKAVTYSDWYARRLRVHRYGSYVMLPLFVTQYVLGDKLLAQKDAQYAGTRLTPIDDGLRSTHAVVAGAVGVLFAVNTATGLWNLFA